MPIAKKKAARAKPKKKAAAAPKWVHLGIGRSDVSKALLERVPLDLVRAEVVRHLKKKHPDNGFLVTETRYANVPFFIATYFDEFHTQAYELLKSRGQHARAETIAPETHVDIGTFQQGLLRSF